MVYLIAEIGQNHNGLRSKALTLINNAIAANVDAVKLCKRDIPSELTRDAYDRVYDGPNSFAYTYGRHREFLELPIDFYKEAKLRCKRFRTDFISTACDVVSLRQLLDIGIDKLKIASRDLTNIPLLNAVKNDVDVPVIISTGLTTYNELKKAYKILNKKDLSILNCTSEYPTLPFHIHLNRIKTLKKKFKFCTIGQSLHYPNIHVALAAVAFGAEILECHLTKYRFDKGSDHRASFYWTELKEIKEQSNILQFVMGTKKLKKEIPEYLQETRQKLMKKPCSDGIYRIH